MQALPAGADALQVEISRSREPPPGSSMIEGDIAEILLVDGGCLRMHCGDGHARFSFPDPPPDLDLLHPYLAPAAALAQLWSGHEALHAGALVAPAGAVLLLAGKEGGKSTTLAWLANELGVPILADDLVVVAQGAALAGPRCLDLRPRALTARRTAPGELVRATTRRRVALGLAPLAAPIAGSVVLGWGPEVELAALPAPQRLRELVAARMYGARIPGDPAALLDLAALPMLHLRRPRGQHGLEAAATALLNRFA
jgi:hypothetical protein